MCFTEFEGRRLRASGRGDRDLRSVKERDKKREVEKKGEEEGVEIISNEGGK